MHDGNHGIAGHTHEALDEKFGHHHEPHETDRDYSKPLVRMSRIVAGAIVAILAVIFVLYRIL